MPPNEVAAGGGVAAGDIDRGTPLHFATAGDVAQLVRARGTTFIVASRTGDITPPGARELGLFSRDTRHLSHYELLVQGGDLVHLSSRSDDDAYNQIDMMVSGLDEGDFLGDPQNFLHIRRRQLLDGAFDEEIELTSHVDRPVDIVVVLRFGADFADVFEVRGAQRPRRGTLAAPQLGERTVELAYTAIHGERFTTLLDFVPTPTALGPDEARFAVHLEPAESTRIEVTIRPRKGQPPLRPRATSFDARARRGRDEVERFRGRASAFRCDNLVVQEALDRAATDLHALRIELDGGAILGAGIPWYCAPFGRDSLLASYEALTLTPDLAVESLRTLAGLQGRAHDPETEEEPGKIFHELRCGEMARTGEVPHRPYFGTIDATPLFVVVTHATYQVTGDLALVRELEPAILAALSWIDTRSDDGRRFVTYSRTGPRGLDNQGWKDSRAGVSFPDGTRAEPPIAVCEVQGYCVDAYARGALLLRALGDARADDFAAKATRLRDRIETDLWMPALGRYAFAVDGRGRRLDTIASNMGHLLWSGVPAPERAHATAALLMRPESFSGLGIRTLARGQRVYNPLSYHNGTVWPHDNALIAQGMASYGLSREATRIFDGLACALGQLEDRRLPELFCGLERGSGLVRYPVACSPQAWAAAATFLLVQAMLGIRIDGPAQTLTIHNPGLPASMKRIEIHRMRVGSSRVTVRFRRIAGKCHVDGIDVEGPPVQVRIEFD